MDKKRLFALLLTIICIVGVGCTPKKDYERENADLKAQVDRLNYELKENQLRMDMKTNEIDQLKEQIADLSRDASGDKKRNLELSAKIKSLSDQLAAKEQEMKNFDEKLKAEADKIRKELSGDIEVLVKNGVVKLILQNKILFQSGSAIVSEKGQKALQEVATLLSKEKYLNHAIRVEGHTDTDKIKSTIIKRYPTNWELSTHRATNVVRFLVEKGKMSPARVYAAGYSKYHPVASNDTKDGKALNRRVEIAILPKMLSFIPRNTEEAQPAE